MNKANRGYAIGLASVLIASVSMAQDIVGEWRADTPQGEMVLTIAKGADNAIEGTMAGGWWTGENQLNSAEFTDGKLSVSSEFEFNGEDLTVWYSGLLEGDSLNGSLKVGDFGEFLLIASRTVDDPPSEKPTYKKPKESYGQSKNTQSESEWTPQDVVGYWRADTPQGLMTIAITMGADGQLEGTMDGGWWNGVNELTEVKFENGELFVVNEFEFSGEEMTVLFSGLLEGHSIEGILRTGDFGQPVITLHRGPAEPTSTKGGSGISALVGNWNMSVRSPDGPREIMLALSEVGGKLTGTWRGSEGVIPIENAHYEDGALTFDIEFESPAGSLGLTFEGRVFEDSFYGALSSPLTRGARTSSSFAFNKAELDLWYDEMSEGNADKKTLKAGDLSIDSLTTDRKMGKDVSAEGMWEISYMRGQKMQKATLRISKRVMSNNSLVGSWNTDQGATELNDVNNRGGVLSFSRNIKTDGRTLDFTYSGAIQGDSIKGAMRSRRFGEHPFQGTRVNDASKKSEFTLAIGNWYFMLDTPQGPHEAEFKLSEVDGHLAGSWMGAQGVIPIKNIEYLDGVSWFDIKVDSPAGPLYVSYEGEFFYTSFYGRLTTSTIRGDRVR
jgi:hypothetical protein